MKMLIIGSKGQLGWELTRQCKNHGFSSMALDLPELDITDLPQVENTISDYKPSIVINASGYTNVDNAETQAGAAFAVNSEGPANLAETCAKHKISFIHISTDYVFDGSKGEPYFETDSVSPLGIYGQSKEEGESRVRSMLEHHIIIRTSWMYGVHGHNFVKTMLRLGNEKEIIKVISDQYGCPTCAFDLAEAIMNISGQIASDSKTAWGTYHYCGHGITTWHGFTKEIFEIASKYRRFKISNVEAITTAEYPTKAKRPPFSALDCNLIKKSFGINTKPWKESLKKTIEQILMNS